MRRHDELANKDSCFNRALPYEWLFTLLARDEAGPATVRFWCQLRVAKGLNKSSDPQIVEAMANADAMERQLQDAEFVFDVARAKEKRALGKPDPGLKVPSDPEWRTRG